MNEQLHIDLSCLHSVIQLTLPVEITIFDCFIALIRTVYVPVASCSSWKALTITTGEVTSTGIHIRTLLKWEMGVRLFCHWIQYISIPKYVWLCDCTWVSAVVEVAMMATKAKIMNNFDIACLVSAFPNRLMPAEWTQTKETKASHVFKLAFLIWTTG